MPRLCDSTNGNMVKKRLRTTRSATPATAAPPSGRSARGRTGRGRAGRSCNGNHGGHHRAGSGDAAMTRAMLLSNIVEMAEKSLAGTARA